MPGCCCYYHGLLGSKIMQEGGFRICLFNVLSSASFLSLLVMKIPFPQCPSYPRCYCLTWFCSCPQHHSCPQCSPNLWHSPSLQHDFRPQCCCCFHQWSCPHHSSSPQCGFSSQRHSVSLLMKASSFSWECSEETKTGTERLREDVITLSCRFFSL